jgi:hypothetical protein
MKYLRRHPLVWVIVPVVVALVAAGTALAVRGDVWAGSAQISVGGTPVFIGEGYVIDTPPVYVYNKTLMFTISNATTPGAPYTVEAKGRLFGNQQFIGFYGNEVTQAFGFRGSAVLKDDAGTILCRSGRLVVGGRWDGDSFGELKLPKSCPGFGGQQYLSFKTRVDGTSIDNASMLQR